MTDASLDEQALRNLLGEGYTVMDLTGCTQEVLNYPLSQGYPVVAARKSQTYLILGYDPYNIWVYDKASGRPKAIASDDSNEEFREQGFQFLTYMAN